MAARYGSGQSTNQRVEALLDEYSSFEYQDKKHQNEVLVVRDEDDVMAALVMTSQVQKEMYKKWGGVLVMDWTHNTNNLNYMLGM